MKMLRVTNYLVLLLAVVLVSATPDDVNGAAKYNFKKCEFDIIRKCNNEYMSAAQAEKKNPDPMKGYCLAYKKESSCFATTSKHCNGHLIDVVRLMVAQHVILNKKADLCPSLESKSFEEMVKGNEKHKSHIQYLARLESDKLEKCALLIHKKCSTELANNLRTHDKMCYDIGKFFKCYQNPGIPCMAKIYRDYLDTFKFAAEVFDVAKLKHGLFPNC